MHFFAQIKPKSYVHVMWTHHNRRSAILDGVLFKADDDGLFSSEELTDAQIKRFLSRQDIVRLVITQARVDEIAAIPDEAIDTSDIPEIDLSKMKPKGRPKLKQ